MASLGLFGWVEFGLCLENILRRLDGLKYKIGNYHMLHSLKEKIIGGSSRPDNKRLNEQIKKILDNLKLEIFDINKEIKAFNKILSMIDVDKKIEPIKYGLLKKIIKIRFSKELDKDDLIKMSDENFKIKLNLEFNKTISSIKDLLNHLDLLEKFEDLKKLDKKYKKGIREAINIWSIGYNKTSVLVIGRTIEDLLNDLLKNLIIKKKIKRFDLNNTKYESKIGMLKDKRKINEQEWHDLNSLRINRNFGGHPFNKKIGKNEARITIAKSILIIKSLQKKIS